MDCELRPCAVPLCAQQYVGMLHILDRLITLKHFVKPLLFEGGMSSIKRDRAVRRFQSDPACQVPLSSILLHDCLIVRYTVSPTSISCADWCANMGCMHARTDLHHQPQGRRRGPEPDGCQPRHPL